MAKPHHKAIKGHLPMSFLLSSRFLYRAVFYRQHAYSRAAYYIYRKCNNAKVNADSEACYVDFYTLYYNKLNYKCRYRCYNRQNPTYCHKLSALPSDKCKIQFETQTKCNGYPTAACDKCKSLLNFNSIHITPREQKSDRMSE